MPTLPIPITSQNVTKNTVCDVDNICATIYFLNDSDTIMFPQTYKGVIQNNIIYYYFTFNGGTTYTINSIKDTQDPILIKPMVINNTIKCFLKCAIYVADKTVLDEQMKNISPTNSKNIDLMINTPKPTTPIPTQNVTNNNIDSFNSYIDSFNSYIDTGDNSNVIPNISTYNVQTSKNLCNPNNPSICMNLFTIGDSCTITFPKTITGIIDNNLIPYFFTFKQGVVYTMNKILSNLDPRLTNPQQSLNTINFYLVCKITILLTPLPQNQLNSSKQFFMVVQTKAQQNQEEQRAQQRAQQIDGPIAAPGSDGQETMAKMDVRNAAQIAAQNAAQQMDGQETMAKMDVRNAAQIAAQEMQAKVAAQNAAKLKW
jgi:hypothetical protein